MSDFKHSVHGYVVPIEKKSQERKLCASTCISIEKENWKKWPYFGSIKKTEDMTMITFAL